MHAVIHYCPTCHFERPAREIAEALEREYGLASELRRAFWELRHGNLAKAAEIARPHRHVVHPHFRWDDPGPLLVRAAWFARRAVARARKAPDPMRRLGVERR